jgi:aminoglycoside 6'-N-acetyltransferase I
MLLSTSDESARTSLFGRELYEDPLAVLDNIAVTGPHPLEFWKAVGYRVVGVIPDAEGLGMPSIMLAKRLGA